MPFLPINFPLKSHSVVVVQYISANKARKLSAKMLIDQHIAIVALY